MKSFSPRKPRPGSYRSAAPAARTSWNAVADWYTDHLKERGDYQDELIFPGALRLLKPKIEGTYIDLACGEGSFLHGIGRHIRRGTLVGVDAAPKLVAQAKSRLKNGQGLQLNFFVGDASKPQKELQHLKADGVSCLMAIQNIEDIVGTFRVTKQLLKPEGVAVFVMNHPCFRQPRQSGWGWDEQRKLQYRRIDRYKTSYEMPIIAHPGAAPSVATLSYHRPLEAYVKALSSAGLVIDRLEEWSSHKTSDSGPRAKAENVAREEIPLFLALRVRPLIGH